MRRFATLLTTLTLVLGGSDFAIAQDERETYEWPHHGGNPQSQQYSALKQIDSSNVRALGLLWYSDLPVQEGLVGNPLVKDGVVYQSVPRGGAVATDVRTGATRWQFSPDFDFTGYSLMSMWAAHSTRGIGLDDAHIYVTGGCELYAVDRKSGTQAWKARVCDPTRDSGMIAAPRTGGGKVFVGVSSGESQTARGFAAAYDGRSGRELWRFYSVPGDPAKPFENEQMQIASKTWGDKYWVETRGSGGVWDGMIYDPQLDLLIFGTGNPGARLKGSGAAYYADKEMLFTSSLVAVNASTGQYAWHFQFLQGDIWDIGDGVAHIVIADLLLKGKRRHVVMQAAKNGFFYLLDAKTGRFISANNYVPVTAYSTMDPVTGRLKIGKQARVWEHPDRPFILQPGANWGAHSWQLSSYDRDAGLFYIPAFIMPTAFGKNAPKQKSFGRLVAWDPVSQSERWHVDHPVTINGGVLSTAGGLVFQGTPEGKLFAYQAADGKLLWSYDLRGIVLGAPSTVMVADKQVILVPSGDATGSATVKMSSYLSTTPQTIAAPSRLLAFALGGAAVLPPAPPKVMLKPARALQPTELAEKGKRVFGVRQCGMCHSGDLNISGRSRVPDLRNIREGTLQAMAAILRDGAYSSMGMPRFPDITDEEIEALQAYIINTAWVAYRAQESGRLLSHH